MVAIQYWLIVRFLIEFFILFFFSDETYKPGRKTGFATICVDIFKCGQERLMHYFLSGGRVTYDPQANTVN
jgi:hypothetical protein